MDDEEKEGLCWLPHDTDLEENEEELLGPGDLENARKEEKKLS